MLPYKKLCKGCKQEKDPFKDFSKDSSSPTGMDLRCKECRKRYIYTRRGLNQNKLVLWPHPNPPTVTDMSPRLVEMLRGYMKYGCRVYVVIEDTGEVFDFPSLTLTEALASKILSKPYDKIETILNESGQVDYKDTRYGQH